MNGSQRSVGKSTSNIRGGVQDDTNSEEGYDRSGFPLTHAPHDLTSSPPSPQLLPTVRSSLSFTQSKNGSPTRIKVRDLSHIQSFASEEVLASSQQGSSRFELKKPEGGAHYEISSMPVTDIIEMVAGLLTKIAMTNDRQHQHEHINRHIPPPDGTSAISQQTASVLSFHGKNVPSINILSYLTRIHKYCPTTYEVFLSLLVYFDRMTEMINKRTLQSFKSAAESAGREVMSPASGSSYSLDKEDKGKAPNTSSTQRPESQITTNGSDSASDSGSLSESDAESNRLAHCFVVDSFNIHRLVIAGVTCASKFFSDVFYTNSRYAKVSSLRIFIAIF
jgi:PHO85 cyclin-6/7